MSLQNSKKKGHFRHFTVLRNSLYKQLGRLGEMELRQEPILSRTKGGRHHLYTKGGGDGGQFRRSQKNHGEV
ncbi:unnamed protein product [Prunus armeniaca]